jgi:L-fucose isomerase-like protein
LGAFLERLGPITQNIEAVDKDAKAKKVKKESIDQNEVAKQKVITAIRGVRDGLVSLESEFRTKPDLKKYLSTIQGISDLAGQSIDSAMAGKFVAANAPLRSVQQKLNDTLTAMPSAEL